jgi:hypothetical protein
MATRKTASASVAKATRKTPKAASQPAAAVPARKPAASPKKPRAVAPAKAPAPPRPVAVPAGEARYRWIAHAAYLRAEKRGFAPGQEVDDWLAAEAEFLAAYGNG